jgi:2-polyprenyl-6-methoxyphenol hydroxylase-like FAD-dependent oxidoreductase
MADAVDVAIVGAGPAGATLALLLGRAGLRVDLYDAHRFPREKPCGEGILPAGVAVLERLGLRQAVGGRELRKVRYEGFGVVASCPFGPPGTVALAQRRRRLDQVLVDAARATPGVRVFEEAEVQDVERHQGRAIGLRVGGQLRRAGLVVGADGLGSRVRRSLGLDRPPRRAGRVGARMHFRLAAGREADDQLTIFVGRGHELYAAPLPDGELLLSALAEPDGWADGARPAFDRWIAEAPPLRALLQGAEPISPPAGRTGLVRRARAGWVPGAVLLGDAAVSTDPLTAGGISHALVTAERLAAAVPDALARGDEALARFDRERWRILRPRAWLTRTLVAIVRRPAAARLTMHLMRAAPPLMRRLVAIGGGVGIQPPVPPPSSAVAASSSDALAISSATDQKAMLPQRVESP